MFSIFSVTLQFMFYLPCNDKNPGSGLFVSSSVVVFLFSFVFPVIAG